MKIAIIRLTSLGDVIHAAASLQIIRRNWPDCSITWVADKRFADILDYQPDIQNIIRIDLKGLKKQKSLVNAVAAEYRRLADFGPFDVIIDLQGMIKSAAIGAILGGEKFGPKHSKERLARLFYNQTIPPQQGHSSAIRATAQVACSLGLDFQAKDLEPPAPYLFWGAEDSAITDEFFPRERRNIIVVPGSSASFKNYSPLQFARLADILQENILLCHGNQQDLATAHQIAEQSAHARVLPRLTLNQLKAAISRADLVIGADTGPIHIAWACGTRSITLFGVTPVCIHSTKRNRAITAVLPATVSKADRRNGLVSNITPEEIARTALEVLQQQEPLYELH